MIEDPSRLESLRRAVEKTESDLRAMGFAVERCVTPPGIRLSSQIFDENSLLLVLFGRIRIDSSEQAFLLGPGDRLEVPAGVPWTLHVERETTAYWIHARIGEGLSPETD